MPVRTQVSTATRRTERRPFRSRPKALPRTGSFSYSEIQADHLLVLELDFDEGTGRAIYNGPEHYVREFLPKEPWKGQKPVSISMLRKAATRIVEVERLPMIRAMPAEGGE